MLHLLPGLDDVADYAARVGSRIGLHRLGGRPGSIRLTRFAGPAVHRGQLEHLRIAHLTDQHVGPLTPLEVQLDAAARANAESPDLVVLTGDFVCHTQLYLDQLIQVIRAFTAPVIAVLGNHDHWSGAAEVRRALKRGGAEVLKNANTLITLRHQRLQVVGLDDAYTGHADVEKAVKGMRRRFPTIALSHIAEEADRLWQHGIPLVLSGHTHGGQVTLARMHELWLGHVVGHRYVQGLYGTRNAVEKGQGAVFVGAGIGASVVPLRLGKHGRREVAIFELGAAPGSFEEPHLEQAPLEGRPPSARTAERRKHKVHRNRLRRERRERRERRG